MFNIGMSELILILVIALIVFGPGKLPEVSKALGKSLQEFRKASSEVTEDVKKQPVDVEKVVEQKEKPSETISKDKQ